jgi:hypothetical protein
VHTGDEAMTESRGQKRYIARHNLKGNMRRYYGVPCSYCRADVGMACHRMPDLQRWTPPHSGRIRAVKSTERNGAAT